MAAFLKSLLSSDYRRGLAAEAAGEYQEAARAYALAGERTRVAEMHLLLAERTAEPDERVAELRAALRWADADDAHTVAVRGRVGRALLEHVKALGVLSERDLGLLGEAGELLVEAGEPAAAAQCFELTGNDARAADCWQLAGEVDRLESALAREEARERVEGGVRAAFEEHQHHLRLGRRDLALERLEDCARLDPGGPYHALLDELRPRRLARGRVSLSIDGKRALVHLGGFPLVFGRDAASTVALRDACVSRRHAEIAERDGRLHLRDLHSRNGTRLRGLRLDGELPLEGEGEIGLGDDCLVGFRLAPGPAPRLLEMEVLRGMDRGLELRAGSGARAVHPGAVLEFSKGRPMLSSAPGHALLLGGVRAREAVQLLAGDEIEILDENGGPSSRIMVGA